MCHNHNVPGAPVAASPNKLIIKLNRQISNKTLTGQSGRSFMKEAQDKVSPSLISHFPELLSVNICPTGLVGIQGVTFRWYFPLTIIFSHDSHLFSTKQCPAVRMIQMCCILSSCSLTASLQLVLDTNCTPLYTCTVHCTVQMADLKSTQEQPLTLYSSDDWTVGPGVRHVTKWIAQCPVINCSNARLTRGEARSEKEKYPLTHSHRVAVSAANLAKSRFRSLDTHLQWFMKITEIADEVCSHFSN